MFSAIAPGRVKRQKEGSKALPKEERVYFKRRRRLPLSPMAKLSGGNKAVVERMLLISRNLREAYLLKEAFYKLMERGG
jgi:transposase